VKREVLGYDVLSDERLAGGGFLSIRRMRLRTVRDDGSRSPPFISDYVERWKGLDAVVVGLWHRDAEGVVHVLLRRGQRPALHFGRPPEQQVIPDRRRHFFFTEVVAGIIEAEDRGEEGIRRRAAAEAWEEAGLQVDPDAVERLGAPIFPTPGMSPECFHLVAAEVDPAGAHPHPPGDGSPMEEGAGLFFLPLSEALRQCAAGEIEDAKTELLLRRLKDRLSAEAPR
jgi:ADP-ribose pyrophosphatase